MRSLPRTLQLFADLNNAIEIQPIGIQESSCTFDAIRPKLPMEHRTCMSRRLCWPLYCLWYDMQKSYATLPRGIPWNVSLVACRFQDFSQIVVTVFAPW